MSTEHCRVCEYLSEKDNKWHALKFYSNAVGNDYTESEYSLDYPSDIIEDKNGNKYFKQSIISDNNHDMYYLVRDSSYSFSLPNDSEINQLEDTYGYTTILLSDLDAIGEREKKDFFEYLYKMINNKNFVSINKKIDGIIDKLNGNVDKIELKKDDSEEDEYYEEDYEDTIKYLITDEVWKFVNIENEVNYWSNLVYSVLHDYVPNRNIRITFFCC